MSEREDFIENALAAAERAVETGNISEETLSIDALRVVLAQAKRARQLQEENDQLREDSERDALTYALTEHAAIRRMQSAIDDMNRARRESDPEAMGVVYIDLRRFKEVNDTYGHAMGDQMLWYFAANAYLVLRDEDIFARLHGDEFIIVLPISKADEAERGVLEVIRRLEENIVYHNERRDQGEPPLRTTMGSALFYRGSNLTPEEMIRQADAAMYVEKERQRQEGE